MRPDPTERQGPPPGPQPRVGRFTSRRQCRTRGGRVAHPRGGREGSRCRSLSPVARGSRSRGTAGVSTSGRRADLMTAPASEARTGDARPGVALLGARTVQGRRRAGRRHTRSRRSLRGIPARPRPAPAGRARPRPARAPAGRRAARAVRASGSRLVHAVYDELPRVLADLGIAAVDGILFDLGVSSMQLDETERGFAYAQDAPLDMRMDDTAPLTAADVLNTYSAADLARILRRYGEERFAKPDRGPDRRRARRGSRSAPAPGCPSWSGTRSRRRHVVPAGILRSGLSRRCGSR